MAAPIIDLVYREPEDAVTDDRWAAPAVNTIRDTKLLNFWMHEPPLYPVGGAEAFGTSSITVGTTTGDEVDVEDASQDFSNVVANAAAELGSHEAWCLVIYDPVYDPVEPWQAFSIRAAAGDTLTLYDPDNLLSALSGQSYAYFVTFDYTSAMLNGAAHDGIDSVPAFLTRPFTAGVPVEVASLGNVTDDGTAQDLSSTLGPATLNFATLDLLVLQINPVTINGAGVFTVYNDDPISAGPHDTFDYNLTLCAATVFLTMKPGTKKLWIQTPGTSSSSVINVSLKRWKY